MRDTPDWQVVATTPRETVQVMRGDERRCRAMAASIVGMYACDGPDDSFGRVVDAWAEPVPDEDGVCPECGGMADA